MRKHTFKLDIGDEMWFIHKDKVVQYTVGAINFSLYYYSSGLTKYETKEFIGGFNLTINEQFIFRTKKELLKSL